MVEGMTLDASYLSYLSSYVSQNLSQYLIITVCTLVMFVMQRRRARRIFRYYRESLVVFTRYPTVGTTKTRLIPTLGDRGAAKVQLMMTDNIIDRSVDYQTKHNDVNVHIQYQGGNDNSMRRWLDCRSRKAAGALTWSPQRGSHLGQRMKNAFLKQFAEGEDRAIIIGSDIPGLRAPVLEKALTELRREDHTDMVLGRATDGGYYLVGLNINAIPKIDSLFEGITWGSALVFDQQKKKAESLGLRLCVLDEELPDVDVVEDLPVLTRELKLRTEDLIYPRWSVVIPVLNEVKNIESAVSSVIKSFSEPSKVEVIVVDGGSVDGTKNCVTRMATQSPLRISLIESARGRGPQLAAGAEKATGFYLLFLHADTTLPPHVDTKAEEVLSKPGNSAGAFRFGLDVNHHPEKGDNCSWLSLFQLRLIERMANWRARTFELPYGDQALFMTRSVYKEVGGFPNWPLLEDYHLVEKLRKHGHVALVEGEPVLTSARRWQQNGAFRVTGFNNFIVFCYKIGVKPATLGTWYYGKSKTD